MSENISKKQRQELDKAAAEIVGYLESQPRTSELSNLIRSAYALRSDIRQKRYGLVYEEHRERVDSELENGLPIIEAVEALDVHGEGPVNAIIEGDNLVALDALERTVRGKVDLIYIDPPYNTGSKNFRYDDTYVEKTDLFRHSQWLSFMRRRLVKARELLGSNGSIFISIDDREQAALKMLCDEVFGVDCFVGCISWQKTYSPKNDSDGIPTEVEYILAYSKYPKWKPRRLARTAEADDRYGSPDGDLRPWSSGDAAAPGAGTHHGMVYAIQHPITGELLYPAIGRHWTYGQDQMLAIMGEWASYHLAEIEDMDKRAEICGTTPEALGKEKTVCAILLDEATEATYRRSRRRYDKGNWPRLYFTSDGIGGMRCKRYLDEVEGIMPTNLWKYTEVGHTDEAMKELKADFGGRAPFETVKPTRLIKRILDIAAPKDALVLDFFAGSGTTGKAVIMRNAEDGGTRRFILCQDECDKTCSEVTYPRCANAIGMGYDVEDEVDVYRKALQVSIKKDAKKGIEGRKDEYKSWPQYVEEASAARKAAKASGEFKSVTMPRVDGGDLVVVGTATRRVETTGALKYYRASILPFDETETYLAADEALRHVRELVELENGVDFSADGPARIALTDKEADLVFADGLEACESIYVGHDVLLTDDQFGQLSELGIALHIIPDYYYQELGE